MDIHDRHEREADHYLATHGLRVPADLLPTVRETLIRETRHESAAYTGTGTIPGNTSLMRICAAQLWHAGVVEDALLIHRARRTSMDATGAIDGQLMLGAGVAQTKRYLTALDTAEAHKILNDISWLEETYDPVRYAADLDNWYHP